MSLFGAMKQKTLNPVEDLDNPKPSLLKKKPAFPPKKPSGLMAKLTGKC